MESWKNTPAPEKAEGEKKEEEKEKVVSKEGLLNRNFGKNVEKPSEALFYRNGILNRPKYQENLAKQREETRASEIKKVKEKLGMIEEKPISKEGFLNRNFGKKTEKPLSPEGLLNRNFGKNKERPQGTA